MKVWTQEGSWPGPMREMRICVSRCDPAQDAIARQVGLTRCQINNWFINRRKRNWVVLFADKSPKVVL